MSRFSSAKTNDVLKNAPTWMDLENMVLSERSQTEEKCHKISCKGDTQDRQVPGEGRTDVPRAWDTGRNGAVVSWLQGFAGV